MTFGLLLFPLFVFEYSLPFLEGSDFWHRSSERVAIIFFWVHEKELLFLYDSISWFLREKNEVFLVYAFGFSKIFHAPTTSSREKKKHFTLSGIKILVCCCSV